MKTYNSFEEFLEDNGTSMEVFFRNYCNFNPSSSNQSVETLNCLFDQNIYSFINTSFMWSSTLEGYTFWRRLNDLWSSLRKKNQGIPLFNSKFNRGGFMKTYNSFEEFLEDNGVSLTGLFLKSCRQFSADRPKNTISDIKLVFDEHPESIIGTCFIWDKTPEGHEFWDNLDKRWVKYQSIYRDIPLLKANNLNGYLSKDLSILTSDSSEDDL